MKFGAHIYLWVDRWSSSALGLFERARGLGLSCLEIAIGDDVAIDTAATRRQAEKTGIELTLGPGAAWPMECDISDDNPANRARGARWHQRNIDLCGELGAVAYTGAIYGHPGRVQRRIPPADEFPRTADNMHQLAEHAARSGVKIVLEPMSHFRTHLLNTPEQAMRLLDLADHPNLSVCLDTYHMITEVRDFAAAVRTAGPRLWGLHACENDRGAPGGGLVPWPAIMSALAQTSAQHILFESYNSSIGGFAPGRGMFHNVCPDGDAFVRQGMAFLRQFIAPPRTVRFAVLRHEGIDSPHFDLLIETGPDRPLATWRCDAWPIAATTTLTRLPDHRRIYLDYEGPVSGGRGTVRRVAGGQCMLRIESNERWIVQLAEMPPLRLMRIDGDCWEIQPRSGGSL